MTPRAAAPRRGRPRTRSGSYATLQTRVPEALHDYIKAISVYRYKTMGAMFEEMYTRFLEERPKKLDLHFRQPKAAIRALRGEGGKTGWVQLNSIVSEALAARLREDALRLEVSLASYLYTSLFWWAMYVYPPKRPE